jgi:hypothetical protein
MAQIHRTRDQNTDDQPGERLKPRLAEIKVKR